MPIPEPQQAVVALSATGFATVVSAVTGSAIRVVSYGLSAANTVSARFYSGTTTGLTGTMLGAANGYYASGYNPAGHFQTAAGAALSGSLSGNVNLQGHLTYVLVT